MGFENKYPYTDFHELNLDWILEVVKRLESEWPEFKTTLETEWNEYKDELTGEGGEWPTFKTQIETIVNNFIHDVVGQYNGNINYQLGMFCYYEGNVYRCTQISTAAYPRPFSSYGWFSYAGQDTNSIVNDLFNYLTTALNDQDNKIYYWIQHTAAQWDETTAYKAGDYCSSYVGGVGTPFTWRYYRCLQDCTNVSIFNTNYWKEVIFASDVAETIAAYKQAMQDQYDEFLEDYQRTFGVVQVRGSSTTGVMSQKAVSDELQAIDNQLQTIDNQLQVHDDMIDNLINDIAPEYDSSEAYQTGILLSYNGKLYECIQDATAGTLPTNTTYFKEVSVAEKLGDLQTGLENGTIVPNKSRATESIENVSDESGTTQENPFISQGTGTNNNVDSVDTSPVAKQIEKQGYTVGNNQFVPDGIFNSTSGWYYVRATGAVSGGVLTLTSTEDGNFTAYRDDIRLMNDHKKLVYMIAKATAGKMLYISGSSSYPTFTATGNWQMCAYIELNGVGSYPRYGLYGGTTGDTCQIKEIRVIDLTQYFNGNSNIPQDLLDNPSHWSWYDNGTGSYDAGSLKNASGRYLVCTKRNIYKPAEAYTIVVPNRAYNYKGGSTTTITYYDKDKNSIGTESVANGSQFTTSANCVYIASSVTSGVTISLYYTAEQGGEGYDADYPYQEPSVYDTGTEELLAFDTKDPDGTWNHNTLEYTITGNEEWHELNANSYFLISSEWQNKPKNNGKIITSVCVSDTANNITNTGVGIGIGGTGNIIVGASDKNKFVVGTKIQFELATPTTEQGTSFAENIEIDDYGMMYWLDTDGNLVDIPQGVKVFYPADYVLWLDTAVSTTNGDATDIALKSEITDTALAERGYNKTSDLSSSITNILEGLSVTYMRCRKTEDVVTLTVCASNQTGATITAGTALFQMPAGTYGGYNVVFPCIRNSQTIFGRVLYNDSGKVNLGEDWANGTILFITLSYVCE